MLLIFLITSLSCEKDENSKGGRNFWSRGNFPERGAAAAVPVKVEKVKREAIDSFILTTTTLEAQREVQVISKASGLVTHLLVEEGDKIVEGQLLAQLDKREIELDMIQEQMILLDAQKNFKRSEEMYRKKLISDQQYESDKYSVDRAYAQLGVAKLKLGYTDITSPISGIITMRNVDVGANVNTNQHLFSVADFDTLLAKIHIPERDIGKVSTGQKAKIDLEALPEREFIGKVTMVSPVVDAHSGTVKITVEIPNSQRLHGTENPLKPGMFASINIITETHRDALVIPKRALNLETDEDNVFVFESDTTTANGIARQVRISPGFADGERIEVLNGLSEGDLVITAGHEGLKTGTNVRVVESAEYPLPVDTMKVATSGGTFTAKGEKGKLEGREMSPEIFKRIKERMLQNPEIKMEYDKMAKKDPDFESTAEKQKEFFRKMPQKMKKRWGGGER